MLRGKTTGRSDLPVKFDSNWVRRAFVSDNIVTTKQCGQTRMSVLPVMKEKMFRGKNNR